MLNSGIAVYACKKCADDLNLTAALEARGITVAYTGVLLSERLKNETVLTL